MPKAREAMLSLDTRVEQLAFDARQRRALKLTGVETVGDFMELDLDAILLLPGCSAKTRSSLQALRIALRHELAGADGSDPVADFLQTDIEELQLDGRACKRLRWLGVATVGDFLVLDLESLPPMWHCGAVTRWRLREAQQRLRERAESRHATKETLPWSGFRGLLTAMGTAEPPAWPASHTAGNAL